jgi:hypothetical protein
VVALTLLARTMGNFQTVVLLLDNGHVVEGRTMARSAFRVDMKEKRGKPNAITHKGAADDGGVGPAYVIYRELSGDAAHPSATSLSTTLTVWGLLDPKYAHPALN